MFSVNTSSGVKYNKTLKALPLFALFAIQLSPQLYFIQTGSSALSNTYRFCWHYYSYINVIEFDKGWFPCTIQFQHHTIAVHIS